MRRQDFFENILKKFSKRSYSHLTGLEEIIINLLSDAISDLEYKHNNELKKMKEEINDLKNRINSGD